MEEEIYLLKNMVLDRTCNKKGSAFLAGEGGGGRRIFGEMEERVGSMDRAGSPLCNGGDGWHMQEEKRDLYGGGRFGYVVEGEVREERKLEERGRREREGNGDYEMGRE